MDGVYAVTVTYGNRWCFLEKVINAALREGVDRVLVIDNNSEAESRENLMRAEQSKPERICVEHLDRNYGSAGGFRKGLEMAFHDPACVFIWLLDDDNEPSPGSLKVLRDAWEKHCKKEAADSFALSAFRENIFSLNYNNSAQSSKTGIGRKNSFLFFDITEFPAKIIRYLRKLSSGTPLSRTSNIKSGNLKRSDRFLSTELKVAPYGGLFFNKSLLSRVGYPKNELFTYMDDFDWTYRVTENNAKIYLMHESIIRDLDVSWNIKKSSIFHAMRDGPDLRVYYTVRNRVYFERSALKSGTAIYWINGVIFLLILRIMVSRRRYSLVKKAVKDGINGKLGMIAHINN